MVACLVTGLLLWRILSGSGGGRVEAAGERGLKGVEEIKRREEELSRREVEAEEERGVEEWQKRIHGGAESWDMVGVREGKVKAADDVEFIDVMRQKPKVSYSVSSTLDRLVAEERALHNPPIAPGRPRDPEPPPTAGGGVPLLPRRCKSIL